MIPKHSNNHRMSMYIPITASLSHTISAPEPLMSVHQTSYIEQTTRSSMFDSIYIATIQLLSSNRGLASSLSLYSSPDSRFQEDHEIIAIHLRLSGRYFVCLCICSAVLVQDLYVMNWAGICW